jgi:hypothetical protein
MSQYDLPCDIEGEPVYTLGLEFQAADAKAYATH